MTESEELLGKDEYGKWAAEVLHKILKNEITMEQFNKEWNEALKKKYEVKP